MSGATSTNKVANSKVGFGGYRISAKSTEHAKALELAIDYGCDLVDTSSNYTNGQSEILIGQTIATTGTQPYLISKVGYIQGDNLEVIKELNESGKAKEDLVELSESLKHSIHPDFIEDQIHRTLGRLNLPKVDCYLLHNPEYAFEDSKVTSDIYYNRIEKAFIKLEELVERGLIDCYGVSSNTFVVDPNMDNHTDLDKIWSIVLKNQFENFKVVQFPFNAIEFGAFTQYESKLPFIQKAKGLGLTTIANRPLNAFSQNGLLRLADNFEALENLNVNQAKQIFDKAIDSLCEKWAEQEEDESVLTVPLIKQIMEIWDKQISIDAVEQIFYGHLFNFIARVWGGSLTPVESKPFYEWFEAACWHAKRNMLDRAEIFHDQAVASGLLPAGEMPLSHKVINLYLESGVDHVLVGMRKEEYVEDLKGFFNVEENL